VVKVHRVLHQEPERKNSMKSFIAFLLVALYTAVTFTPQAVQAAPPGIPAGVYPAGAHIGYHPVLTNSEMDCMWGFFCEGNVPLFHFETQNQLHRLAGWGQFAGVQRRGQITMSFELFVSQYGPAGDETGIPWSERAFLDLKMALRTRGYHFERHQSDLLLAIREGDALVAVQQLGKQDLVVMATWSQGVEIEGIALYDHRSGKAKHTARASLALQIHFATERGA
jgi:hypothetical protein